MRSRYRVGADAVHLIGFIAICARIVHVAQKVKTYVLPLHQTLLSILLPNSTFVLRAINHLLTYLLTNIRTLKSFHSSYYVPVLYCFVLYLPV